MPVNNISPIFEAALSSYTQEEPVVPDHDTHTSVASSLTTEEKWNLIPNSKWNNNLAVLEVPRLRSTEYTEGSVEPTTDVNKANLILSKGPDSYCHYPVLDLDFRAHLIPSSTKGHHHLYLEKALSHDDYLLLLTVLERLGIIQKGILNRFLESGFTCVRPPWLKKGDPDDFDTVKPEASETGSQDKKPPF